jgi:signal transduction histidine kinase
LSKEPTFHPTAAPGSQSNRPPNAWELLEAKARDLEIARITPGLLAASPPRRDPAESGRRTDKLRALSMAIARSQDRERRALARDLHDDLGQMLAVVALKVAMIKRLNTAAHLQPAIDDCTAVVEQVNRKVRSMALQLAPPIIEQRGLVAALQWLVEEVHRGDSLSVDFQDDGRAKEMDPIVVSALLIAVRELLSNVVQHSGVAQASVATLRGEANTVLVTVSDAGAGFDSDTLAAATQDTGCGLLGLRERLGFLGGTVTIRSGRGEGTSITLQVPLSLTDSVDSRKGPVG